MASSSSRLFLGLIPIYGLLIVIGAIAAILIAGREANRLKLPRDTVIDLALRILPFGILGARCYYVVFSWPVFRSNPISVLYLWEGGLAIYGGLIAGFLTVFFFCRKRNLSFPLILDILSPGLALAQAVGRWGNYFNQEAYGISLSPNSVFRFFPLAVLIPHENGLQWHIAAFFLESSWDFLVFLILLLIRRRLIRKQGDVFLFYLAFYSAGRLVIENLRMDSLYLGTRIRISLLVSVLICFMVLMVFVLRREKNRGRLNPADAGLLFICILSNLFVLYFCLFGFPSGQPGIMRQSMMLSLYSVLSILAVLYFYGRSKPAEVIYAWHKSE